MAEAVEQDYQGKLANERVTGSEAEAVGETEETPGENIYWPFWFGFAVIGDLLSLIPIVGMITGPFWIGIISLHFSGQGISIFNQPWRFLGFTLSLPAELIEIVNELPAITAYVLTCYLTRKLS